VICRFVNHDGTTDTTKIGKDYASQSTRVGDLACARQLKLVSDLFILLLPLRRDRRVVVFKFSAANSMFAPIASDTERIATIVLDAAFQVHRALGPGLLESVYEAYLSYELAQRNIPFKCQVALPVVYGGVRLEAGLRLDFLVADSVIVELKSVEKMNSLYEAQLLTYLKLSGQRLGILINFNVPLLKDGIKRVVL
jgi:GxxExxY protein